MVLVCFVLDLSVMPPPLLENLKECLLQLANLYSISSSSRHQSKLLENKIGLCYVFKSRTSRFNELKIAYCPRGEFSLRDFHRAVTDLPTDAFLPETDDEGFLCSRDLKLSSILSDEVLYSWGVKDDFRKVIVLSSCVPANLDSTTKVALADAADKCVTVEFVVFEQSWTHLSNVQEKINCFLRSSADIDNCSFQNFLPDSRVFNRLVKKWLLDLKDDTEESLCAHFIFNSNIIGSLNQIYCSLSKTVCQLFEFRSHQSCRCRDTQSDNKVDHNVDCSVTGHHLGVLDTTDNSVEVNDEKFLSMPCFLSYVTLQQLSSHIEFHIIERTNLESVSESVLIGPSYFVTPSACHEVETSSDDQSELNAQCEMESLNLNISFFCVYAVQRVGDLPDCFQGICSALHSMDQALQLAGSEEVLPMPDVNQFTGSLTEEIKKSIGASLLKIELRDYNPVLHESGFHQKLNLLMKDGTRSGSVQSKLNEVTLEANPEHPDSLEVIPQSSKLPEAKIVDLTATCAANPDHPHQLDMIAGPSRVLGDDIVDLTIAEEKTAPSISEEWEQLIVCENPKSNSPTSVYRARTDRFVKTPPDSNKQLDLKTSKILERLEVPRQLKAKAVSPVIPNRIVSETCVLTKKPLIQALPNQTAGQRFTSSQLRKPSFQRLKRKHI